MAFIVFAELLFPDRAIWDNWKKNPNNWANLTILVLLIAAKRVQTNE